MFFEQIISLFHLAFYSFLFPGFFSDAKYNASTHTPIVSNNSSLNHRPVHSPAFYVLNPGASRDNLLAQHILSYLLE